jgi:hypothetical protein
VPGMPGRDDNRAALFRKVVNASRINPSPEGMRISLLMANLAQPLWSSSAVPLIRSIPRGCASGFSFIIPSPLRRARVGVIIFGG